MDTLMISLDKNILNKDSGVAERMKQYGQSDRIFIIIPDKGQDKFDLSSSVRVFSTGGNNKIFQFFKLLKLGKKIIKENRIEEITAQDPFFIGLAGVLLKNKFNIRLEIQAHGDFWNSSYYKKQFLRLRLGLWVIRHADKIRVVGERIKHSLVQSGIKENKIEIKPIEVLSQYKLFNEIKKDNILKKEYLNFDKIFVWGGRMEPVKNLFWLIEVFFEVLKKQPNYLLLLIGEGSQKNGLQAKAQELGLDRNIIFISWRESLIPFISNADCVLFPSLSEGYGLLAMEAYDAGTPIIMTDVGVANYELKPGLKVIIIPVGDKDEFTQAILSF